MRIAICAFRQESNSFNPVLSGLDFYERGAIFEGQAMYDFAKEKQGTVGAMVEAVEKEGVKPEMLCFMSALSSGGPATDAVVDRFVERTTSLLKDCLPLDGLLVSLHGATVSESREDVCGYILEKLREQVGPTVLISSSYDLHANITDRIQRNADFICGYQTYPHVDFYETGARAARLLLDSLKGRIHARTYRTTVPMIVPAGSYTTLRGFFGDLIKHAHSMVDSGRILDFTVFQAQPWLDVKEIGASIVTIGEDGTQAKACGYELAEMLFDNREAFRQNLYTIDEVIRKAEANTTGKPLVLCDAPDSTNAGACGDSPAVLERIKALDSDVKAAFYLRDNPAVEALWDKEPGSIQHISLGGTLCSTFYRPVELDVKVVSKHSPQPGVSVSGSGRVVVVRWRNVDIVILEYISGSGNPALYRSFGIEPSDYQLVNVKACTSFRIAYEPISCEICETNTPGAAAADLTALDFRRLPKDRMFPFADISGCRIKEPVALR